MIHYNGSSEYERRISGIRQKLSNLLYNNAMTFNFKIFYKNIKSTFDNMEKYGKGISDQDKVRIIPENIHMMKHKLESAINFWRSNHNGNYLVRKNCLTTKISFRSRSQNPIKQKNHVRNKRNVSHVREYNFNRKKSYNCVDISDTTRLFLSEESRKIRNNHGVLKAIQDCPRRNNNSEDLNRRKNVTRNKNYNTSKINNDITYIAIT